MEESALPASTNGLLGEMFATRQSQLRDTRQRFTTAGAALKASRKPIKLRLGWTPPGTSWRPKDASPSTRPGCIS